MLCPLCLSTDTHFYWQDKKRPYQQCSNCNLVFVPSEHHLSVTDEKAEYDLHDNGQLDAGYRQFLSRALDPLLERIAPSDVGLDFGCGEGKVLSQMAAEHDIQVENYDLYYHADESVLTGQYDFITMTEVIEHLRQPSKVLPQLWQLLRTKGLLCVMTKRVLSKEAFGRWHYKNDQTHVAFYSDQTFSWLANYVEAELEVVDKDVVLLQKT